MKHLPNALTALRLVLSLFVFFALLAAGRVYEPVDPQMYLALQRWAFVAFVVAAVTDFADGWLARRYNAVSVTGAILDPIADKVLICAAFLGLIALEASATILIAAGLIFFREFAVSALREVTAARGVKLPVTLLAKWKTTLQLLAIGAELIVLGGWAAFALPSDDALYRTARIGADTLLWVACLVTLVTGAQYVAQAWRAMAERR